MRIKLNNNVRPEFRRLIKQFRNFNDLAEWLLSDNPNADKDTIRKLELNLAQCKMRGYLPVKYAKIADRQSGGNFKAKLLAMKGELV